MAQLSKEAFLSRYNDATSGLYRSGQTQGIGSDDHRSLVRDIFDSIPFLNDDNDFGVPFKRLFITSNETEWDWLNGYFSLGLVEASADFELSFVNQVLGSQGSLFVKKTILGDVVITIPTHQQVGAAGTTSTITLSGDDEQIFRIDFFKTETSSFNQIATTVVDFDKIKHISSTNVLAFRGQDIYRSTDSGISWSVIYSTTDDEIIDFSFTGNDGVLLTRSENGSNYDFSIYTSSDGGDNFSSYSVGSALSNRNSSHCIKIVYYSSGVFYTAGDLGFSNQAIFYRITSNVATSFTPTAAYTISSDFELLSTDLWIVCISHLGFNSIVLKRTGNTTFSGVQTSPIGENSIRDIAAATSSLVIAVGNDVSQNPIIAKSVDGGATFAAKTINNDIGILRKVDAVSSTSFIVTGDSGIGYSTDSGETWTYYPTPVGGNFLSAWDSDDILIASGTSIFKGFGSDVGDIFQLHNDNSQAVITFSKKVTISSAEMLAINSSPKILINAPGASKFLQIIKCDVYYNYVSAAYATNLVTRVRYGTGASAPVAASQSNVYINSTNDMFVSLVTTNIFNNFSISSFENQSLYFDVQTGNPTTGDGDLTVYLTYSIISI